MFIDRKRLSTKQIILILIVFIMALTCIRLIWISVNKPPVQPQAEQDILDLSSWNFAKKDSLLLDGEWVYYPNEFINPNQKHREDIPHQFISVPNSLSNSFNQTDKTEHTHGTYRLQIKLPKVIDSHRFGMRIQEIFTAANIFINGELVAQNGQPSQTSFK